MRSPSVFLDSSVRPSFLRTTPAKKPRTECCCQLVAFIIAAIVVPFGWLSRPITVDCFELERGFAAWPIAVRCVLFAGRLRGVLAFFRCLLLGMSRSFLR